MHEFPCSWLCRAGKERKKEDRYALDCQERAYWLVNRTPVSRGDRVTWCPPWDKLPCGKGTAPGKGQPRPALSPHCLSWVALEGARDRGPAAAPLLEGGHSQIWEPELPKALLAGSCWQCGLGGVSPCICVIHKAFKPKL